nr:restriction endonuclease subunit S [Collinsella sp. TM09-10AT]
MTAWEQRKLGELFVESDERSSTEEILSVSVANGIYPASESERDTNPGASIANYKIVRVGDIVYNSMRMWQGAVGSSRYNGIVSPAYVVAKPVVELDSTCFGYLLKRPELLYKYLCNSQGNSKDTQTLRYERFAEITAEVPSTIEEQRAISDCLEGLDNLIALHQRKCRYRGLCGYLSWEQRKLGDVGKKVTTKNADGALNETFTNSAERGIVSQLDYFDHDITNEANANGYYVVHPNDFVYNPRISTIAPCGPINRNRLNRTGVMSPLYTVFSIDDGVCKTYLEHYFKTSRWHDFMFLEGNTGARSDRFSISDSMFFEMPIWCPSLAEQEAIAQQLELTDNLITLHQRQRQEGDDVLCLGRK